MGEPKRCANCRADLPTDIPEPTGCRYGCPDWDVWTVPAEIVEMLAAKHMNAADEGTSIYDDGDPFGDRIVTVWKDRRGYRFHNVRPKQIDAGDNPGKWTVTVTYDRVDFLSRLDEHTNDEDRYRDGKDMGRAG